MADGTEKCASENVLSAPSVQPIDRRSVHQICSGQVVLNLATAVKELVENSLDAGATIIEVKLKENGADLVEVIDNGCGVKPENFAALTLKHYTSKLRDFSDLANVETFGFRGEALSSLCALSDLSIMTRHNSEAAGTKLEYDHNGKILTKTPCARELGSTVILHNLFATLPVRHKEFLRNLKKEYIKLLQVLHAYCVISCGVRISCSNQLEKGRRNLVVTTNGSLDVKGNITCVFGPKQIQSLLPIQQVEPSEDDCEVYGLDPQDVKKKSNIFQISGYVSKADHGMGRSSADRQFFFINKRPCDFVKVSRVVNEVYHMYNRHQYPFVVLDISLARDSVDVNVTPDKRQVFIQEEKLLLSTIKTSLKKMMEPSGSAFDVNQGLKSQTKLAPSISVLRQRYQQDENYKTVHVDVTTRTDKRNLERTGSEKEIFPSLANFKRKCDIKSNEPRAKQAKLTAMFSSSADDETDSIIDHTNESCGSVLDLTIGSAAEIEEESDAWQARNSYTVEDNKLENVVYESKASSEFEMISNGKVTQSTDCEGEILPYEASTTLKDVPTSTEQLTSLIDDVVESENVGSGILVVSDTEELDTPDSPAKSVRKSKARSCKMKINRLENENVEKHTYSFAEIVTARESVKIDFDLKELQRVCKSNSVQRKTHAAKARLFRAKIAPESSQKAEDELRKHVSKEMFSKMEILGQFNLGFIITKSGDDLFLIDQHASDEKYNFEDQQRNSNLKSQKLILPQHLELTAVNENILADNVEVFRKNGFEFEIDETAPPTKRVKLTSLPMSKNWTFGVEDIEELVFMLSDSPGTMCRPSRVRKMFASRACRMSVMVGTALDHAQMKRIVGHMGLMDQPWNCPHGRPTMRHLINLCMISSPK